MRQPLYAYTIEYVYTCPDTTGKPSSILGYAYPDQLGSDLQSAIDHASKHASITKIEVFSVGGNHVESNLQV